MYWNLREQPSGNLLTQQHSWSGQACSDGGVVSEQLSLHVGACGWPLITVGLILFKLLWSRDDGVCQFSSSVATRPQGVQNRRNLAKSNSKITGAGGVTPDK